jgi:polyferredoxin
MKLEALVSWVRLARILLLLALLPIGTVALPAEDGFVAWEDEVSIESAGTRAASEPETCETPMPLIWKYGSMGLMVLFTLIGALALRFRRLLRLRPLALLLTLSVVGFYFGGCPCPIKGMQSPFASLGSATPIHWLPLGGLLIILLSSYLFGPTFCGWGCPLGALQEFLFLRRNAAAPSDRMRQVFLWIRRGATLLLILWLVITGTIFWEEIDPFKAIFTFQIFNITTWILVGAVLLSSLYLFRPFCRIFCPVGLLNGRIARLPGAHGGPQVQASCTRCMRCAKTCKTGALNNPAKIARELCIGCGDCLPQCGKKALSWRRNRKGNSPEAPASRCERGIPIRRPKAVDEKGGTSRGEIPRPVSRGGKTVFFGDGRL